MLISFPLLKKYKQKKYNYVNYINLIVSLKMTKVSAYSLVSCFDDDNIQIHDISHDIEGLTCKMQRMAAEGIHNEIGKNNYNDTLNDPQYKDLPIEKCPAGFVLRMVEQKHENHARRLNVHYHNMIPGLWGHTHKVELRGYYLIVELGKQYEADVVNAPVIPTRVVTSMPNRPTRSYSSVDASSRGAWDKMIPEFMEELKAHKLRAHALETTPVETTPATVTEERNAAICEDTTDDVLLVEETSDVSEGSSEFRRQIAERARIVSLQLKKKSHFE